MELCGTLEDIIFRNEENGYTVLVLDVEGEPVTVVGSFPVLAEGETLVLDGEYKQNPKYGRQFAAVGLRTAAPSSRIGIVRFLAGGLIRGVGEVTATNIVDRFGEESLEIIEHDPHRLALIRGISVRKANEIHDSYMEVACMRAAVMFLQNYGIGAGTAVKIFNCYGAKTQAAVQSNPYRLVEDVDGIGFLTADRIARAMGIEADSEFRVRAGIVHLLKYASESQGHTYLPLPVLVEETNRLLALELDEEAVRDVTQVLAIAGTVRVTLLADGETAVMLARFYRMEKGIADRLLGLLRDADTQIARPADQVAAYERANGVRFHELQREAVAMALTEGVSVITGGPGTGKTTIIKCVLSVLRANGNTVKLLAPTGRAAKRMTETTGEEAFTIHRALQSEGEGGKFSKNESNPIEATYVIVDEVSMVDAFLMYSLLKAIRSGTKLLLVGDKDQLPSVGAGNVLGDVLASKTVPVTYLTQIYRQAQESFIVTNAHRINEGEFPVVKNDAESDFFFLRREGTENIADTVVEMLTTRVPKYLGVEPTRVQVLSPVKQGTAGVVNLNRLVQERLNPKEKGKRELQFGDTVFRTGDKVMHVNNDYDIEWTRRTALKLDTGTGVFNGDIGTIAAIYDSGELDVEFEDGKLVRYNREQQEELMLSYAITVHKSQGCEFDAVVMPILAGSPGIITRNLLYTGITRAKRMVVLVGSQYNLTRMIDNDYTQKRYSRLAELLADETARLL